jgi:hypothetical protein
MLAERLLEHYQSTMAFGCHSSQCLQGIVKTSSTKAMTTKKITVNGLQDENGEQSTW